MHTISPKARCSTIGRVSNASVHDHHGISSFRFMVLVPSDLRISLLWFRIVVMDRTNRNSRVLEMPRFPHKHCFSHIVRNIHMNSDSSVSGYRAQPPSLRLRQQLLKRQDHSFLYLFALGFGVVRLQGVRPAVAMRVRGHDPWRKANCWISICNLRRVFGKS